jgi:endonuclease/exonuclease/phosphatase family metal-dependent hydrolase
MMPPRDEGGSVAALRIMTFNLRRDVAADGPHRWAERKDLVARLVRRHAPHVVGTQEGLAHQLADLDARLPGYRRVGGCRQGDGSDEHNAIYYDATRMSLVEHDDFWLSDAPQRPGSATWGNRHPRMVTWARLHDAVSGHDVTVANTHLDHESPRARREAAALIMRRIPHAILLGDFNEEPGSEVHKILCGASRKDTTHLDETPTFHGFTAHNRARLDWILVPVGAHVKHAAVLKERPEGRYPSDHDPVMADVVV